MSDTYEHNPNDHEDPLAGVTMMVGGLGAIGLVAIMLLLTAIYYNAKTDDVRAKVYMQEREEVRDLYVAQENLLHETGRQPRDVLGEMVDVNVIPIDQAMDIIVAEAGR